MAPAAPPGAATRRPLVDLLRFVAAFGIVYAQMGAPGRQAGYAALAAFLILTAFLSLRSWRRGARPEEGPTGALAPDRGLALLGGLAFGIHLLHPALMLVRWTLAPGLPLPLGAVAAFLASALLAWGLWRLPLGRPARPTAAGRARAPRARGAPS